MTMYTIMPLEKVFAGFDVHKPSYVEINVDGILMQVEMVSHEQARIMRIFSGSAADYLNPRYAPGSLIEFRPAVGTIT